MKLFPTINAYSFSKVSSITITNRRNPTTWQFDVMVLLYTRPWWLYLRCSKLSQLSGRAGMA